MHQQHQSVLLQESLEQLNLKSSGIYVDATFGRGGHSKAILNRIGPKGKLIAMDKDIEAVNFGLKEFGSDKRFIIKHASFTHLSSLINEIQLQNQIDGILFDLGVSSPQLDDSHRGFSFRQEGPLDMRMDSTQPLTAKRWLAAVEEKELVRILREYGEERFARRIASQICKVRKIEPITSTLQLANLVKHVVPAQKKRTQRPTIHPATKTFQAIRIFINQELEELKVGLNQAVLELAPNGRLVVISFHSLEDRIVKRFIRLKSQGENVPRDLPIIVPVFKPEIKKIGRLIRPTDKECQLNPRARSARMRVAEKCDA